MSVNTSQHGELSLRKYSDNPKQVAGRFVSELDEHFSLKKTPEEPCLPVVFR
jgi:hypothetical protein